MLIQQMIQDETNMSGTLTIKAEPGYLAELISLATELSYRDNITTNGTISNRPPVEAPAVEDPLP